MSPTESSSKSSSCVYINDSKHGWLPATIVSQDNEAQTVTVSVVKPGQHDDVGATDPPAVKEDVTVKLSEYPNNVLPLQNVDENGSPIEMADMCDLPALHEAAILYNLKARYEMDSPYTRTGDIVIALNPFTWLEDLYSDDTRELYSAKLVWEASKERDTKSSLKPHVYESSSLAYRGLASDGKDQSILVSGESGAGKTETVKIVMTHLASVQSKATTVHNHARSDLVVKRVLDSNPLLEAFGNAKTVRNDNSSRFGKYTQLQFEGEDAEEAAFAGRSVPSCILAGSYCETYLLEKSRVVSHEAEERTYHIFYQLLAAPDDVKADIWDGLSGKGNSSFKYVGHTDTVTIEGRSDAEKWTRTCDALALIGISGDKLKTMMRAVCTVMQLGNLIFSDDPSNEEGSIITSTDELKALAGLMGLPSDDLGSSLTSRTVTAGKEVYSVPLKTSDAVDSCDAFAKEIYHQIFDWLVRSINAATSAEFNYEGAKEVEQFGIIGLLDIFGFESFKVNRFEQLCINYTNEKLQQKYVLDVFRSVKDEYEFEGIGAVDVTIDDNADVLNLLEGRIGLLSVLNEECVRPKGNDTSFVSKAKMMNKESEYLVQDKLHSPCEFAIEHYAGAVKYDATNFVKKNNDSLPLDLLECAGKSTNDIISTELHAVAESLIAAKAQGGRGKPSSVTIASKFKSQLGSLMVNIGKTRTRYIRCIKPNREHTPRVMDLLSSVEQLRCAGIVAAVTVSRVAFPNRLLHETVINRFQFLAEETPAESEEKKEYEPDETESEWRKDVENLLTSLLRPMEVIHDGIVKNAFVCGKTRVYFRMGALEYLESERLAALGKMATVMQRYVRGYVAQLRYTTMQDSAIMAQAFSRRTSARHEFLRAKGACLVLSCWIRCLMANATLAVLRKDKASCMIQTSWRRDRAVALLLRCKASAITMQRVARGALQRPIYQTMLAEAIEEAKVNSKVQALQRRLAEAEMKWIQAEKQRAEAEERAANVAAAVPEQGVEEEKKAGESMSSLQHALFEESQQVLDYLKKDVFNLKAKNYLLRTDLDEMKNSNYELAEHNAAVTASLEALKQHANQLSKQNMRLMVETRKQKEAIKNLRTEINVNKYSYLSDLSKQKEDERKKDAGHKAEIAGLKKELFDAKQHPQQKRSQSKGTPPRPRYKKQPSSGRSTPSSGRSNSFTLRRNASIDSLDKWGHDGYWATASCSTSDSGSHSRSKKRGKYTMGKRQDSFSDLRSNAIRGRQQSHSPKRPPKQQYKSLQKAMQKGKSQRHRPAGPSTAKQKVSSSLAAAVTSSINTTSTKTETRKSIDSSLSKALLSSKTNASSLSKAASSSSLRVPVATPDTKKT